MMLPIKEICPKDKCTGCSSCMNACPHSAISMIEDKVSGYIFPSINESKCVGCGLCKTTCPSLNPPHLNTPIQAFASRAKLPETYKNTASGGVSAIISDYFISTGGVVYGCEAKGWENFSHVRCTNHSEVTKIRGSKYVQSNIGLTYRLVYNDILSGKNVLFTGTPCQVAGLRNYLKKDFMNLYCIDLVCHGISSQKFLKDDIEYLQIKYHCRISETEVLKFRIKKPGERLPIKYGLFFNNVNIPTKALYFPNDNYITAFMNGLILRESCFNCTYAQQMRVGDITLGDFWGLPEDSTLESPVGLVLCSTNKGMELLNKIKNELNSEERDIHEAIRGNGQLNGPSTRPFNRNDFLRDYSVKGQSAYKKYLFTYRKEIRKKNFILSIKCAIKKVPFVYKIYKKLT